MPTQPTQPKPVSRSITLPRGFTAGATTCGIKPSGQPDLTVIVADVAASAAGVLTQSRTPGAPVAVCRKHLRRGRARAIVCNSGVANVATGPQGARDAVAMCDAVAKCIGCRREEVLVCSTGVIGQYLPMHLILPGIHVACNNRRRHGSADRGAAEAMLTTDTRVKSSRGRLSQPQRRSRGNGKNMNHDILLGGIAKGSGMIAPNMATMLAFITTDAGIAPPLLRRALRHAVAQSFNRISIDSDTSTSDAVLILASGSSLAAPITSEGPRFARFTDRLAQLCHDLAYQVVADGEGATRVMRVMIQGAATEADADRIGRSVANSPLVKTALHGADPNWGRVVMAIGKSGAKVVMENLAISIAGRTVFRRGSALSLSDAARRVTVRAMKKNEVAIQIELGIGTASVEWLGCDLSREYITINADYTT